MDIKLKNLKLIAFILLLSQSALSQNLNLDWVAEFNRSGGTNMAYIEDLVIDSDGNTISVGTFSGKMDFDPDTAAADTFFVSSSLNVESGFICKLDSLGKLVWVREVDLGIGPGPAAVALDQNDDIYITGDFRGTVDFDPGASSRNLTSSAGDAFIMKLAANGDFRWAHNYASSSGDDVAVGPNGNVYYTGANDFDIYIIKLDSSNGSILWRRNLDATAIVRASIMGGLAIDSSLNVYSTGFAGADIDFDPSPTATAFLGTNNEYFVQKLDSNGNFEWAVKGLGTRSAGEDIILSNDGQHIYTGGFYDPQSSFNRLAFVNKLDTSGNLIWSYTSSGDGSAGVSALTRDNHDNIYSVGGYFANIGGLQFNGANGTQLSFAPNTNGAFIQRMDSSGRMEWVESISGYSQANISASGVALHHNLDIQLCGRFTDTVDMDPGLGSYLLFGGSPPFGSSSRPDLFTSRLSQCFNTYFTDVQVVCDSLNWIDGVTYFSSTNSPTYIIPNLSGCDSIIILNLTVDSIDTGLTQNNDSLFSSQLNASSYQWLDCSNSNLPISGANGRKFVPSQNGIYAVEVTNNGCTDTSACFSFISTGLNEQQLLKDFKLFPNPTSQKVKLKINGKQIGEVLEIYSLNNVIVYRSVIKEELTEVDVSRLPAGIYYVKVGVRLAKLVVYK